MLEVLFQINAAVLEGRLGLLASGPQAGEQADVIAGDAHAPAAAAGGGLDQHRVADLLGKGQRLLVAVDQPLAARHDRDAGLFGEFARLVLVAELRMAASGGPINSMPASPAHVGKVGLFREKAIAGVNGVDVGQFRGLDDVGGFEITLDSMRRARCKWPDPRA